MSRPAWAGVLLAALIVAMVTANNFVERRRKAASLAARLDRIVTIGDYTEVSCADVAATRPLVLLALGQSNAGNHGSAPTHAAEPVTVFADGKCVIATDPLPGGTGTGGSIWQRLPALLAQQKESRPIVLSPLAVDATTIDDWTNPSSPLAKRLVSHVASMKHRGLPPDLVLWQQGEADALRGTGSEQYSAGLDRLAAMLTEVGNDAPLVLARSTICRSPPSTEIRTAIEGRVSTNQRFRLGPDTDTLSSDSVRNSCHLTSAGLDSAAKMWATAISTEASTIRRTTKPYLTRAQAVDPGI